MRNKLNGKAIVLMRKRNGRTEDGNVQLSIGQTQQIQMYLHYVECGYIQQSE